MQGKIGKSVRCSFLDALRYFCPEPMIDSSTQAAVGCTKNHTVEGKNWRALNTQSSYCLLNLHIILFISFHHSEMQDCACRKRWSKYHWMHSKRIMPLYVSLPQVDLIFTIILCFKTKLFIEKSCCFTFSNDHSYETALLLSVFLGMCGIDRFYLGYPAIG